LQAVGGRELHSKFVGTPFIIVVQHCYRTQRASRDTTLSGSICSAAERPDNSYPGITAAHIHLRVATDCDDNFDVYAFLGERTFYGTLERRPAYGWDNDTA